MLVLAAASVTLVLAGNLMQAPSVRAEDHHSLPTVHEREHPVAGHALSKVKPRRIDPLVKKGKAHPAVVWPKAGTATVSLPTAAHASRTGTDEPGQVRRAGQTVVQVGKPAAGHSATAGSVRVHVLGRTVAKHAKVDGVLLTVSRTDADTAGRVEVRVDYSGFAAAYGGDYAGRLRLTRLPACVLTTPTVPKCRKATDLRSRNDGSQQTVSAVVTAEPASGTSALQDMTVLALASSSSGAKGDYGATSLSPGSSWQTSIQTGSFSWSYPLRVPAVPGNVTPDLALGYSSGAVDGATSATNNQVSWLGQGFDMWPGYIERSYKSCSDDGAPEGPYGNKPVDRCWDYDNATLDWNGHSGQLIPDSDGTWRLKDDDGTRFEKATGGTNGDDDGEYWVATTPDGTRYYFGRNRLPGWSTDDPTTDSTWTEPVYGNDSGEPCHGDNFDSSWCQQAWRWNLDYVVDPHGNAMSYWYGKETNYYGRDLDPAKGTVYVRGGYLDRIEYGQRSDSLYSTKAPARVLFDNVERCIPDATFDCDPAQIGTHPDYWPDVPWDMNCTSGQDCTDGHGSATPTFWTRKRLDAVTTQLITSDGAGYQDVDSWSFGHTWGEADIDRSLLLTSIQHTGKAAGATAITLPKVTFDYVQRASRIDSPTDDIPPFIKYRLSSVFDESGGELDVNYSEPDCAIGDLPDPATNTRRCYPVKWMPAGYTESKTDWFNKYVTTKVIQTDRTGKSPDQITEYHYQGGGAWHYDEPNGLVKEKDKSWSQWRGYAQVLVETGGTEGMKTQTDHFYLRGMDGDRQSATGGQKSVSVDDGEGDTFTDHDAYSGLQYKLVQHDGVGGAVLSKTVTKPWSHATASHTYSWGTLTAQLTGSSGAESWTALADGTWQHTQTDETHDTTTGAVTQTTDYGDTSTAADNRCTRIDYAQNTTAWMLTYPKRVETVAVACDATPSRPDDVLSDLRTYYDGHTLDAAPTTGEVTKTEKIASYTDSTPTYVSAGTDTYDAYGRQISSTDVAGRTETTSYTETHGLTTKIITTSPPAVAGDASTEQSITSTIDPTIGQATEQIDQNGKKTDLVYDALGRLLKVWLPNTRMGANSPNYEYSYRFAEGDIVAVGSRHITPAGGQTPWSYTLYDGWMRERQTQQVGADGGRLIADTFYNSTGKVSKTYDPYYSTGAPSTVLFGVDQVGNVETQHANTYDGAGRLTAERWLVGSSGTDTATEKWRTSYSYTGNSVSVTPPAGGTPTTTISNAHGQQTEIRTYLGADPTGTYQSTTYTYTAAGKLATVTDPSGSVLSHSYDLRGREIEQNDPDSGKTSYSYNDLDQLVSTTDARGKKIVYSYDGLDRKTAEHSGSATGDLIATWTYDTLAKGTLSSSTRYSNGDAYTTKVNAYDNLYQPLRQTITIPESEGALAGSYQFNTTYNLDSTVRSTGSPAAGDLPAEAIVYGYDDLARPITSKGLSTYVTATHYSPTNQLDQLVLSAGGKQVGETYSYEYGTRRLAEARVDVQDIPGVPRDAKYGYNDAGDITSIADVSKYGTDTQCFSYDHLRRLTQAWTQNTATCDATPSSDAVGGVAPYWHTYSYNTTGDRTQLVDHATGTGDTDSTTTYTYNPDSPQPHALQSTSTTSGALTESTSYTYDADGNTTSRTIGSNTQTLDWTIDGRLSTATSQSSGDSTNYVYDTDGNRLVQHTATDATLYLPGMELRLDYATSAVTGTRYYSFAGRQIAQRTASGVQLLATDAQNTAVESIDASGNITRRYYTPFGQPRGDGGGTWPGTHGFIAGVDDPATGLVHLGAREYDPDLGRFISPDPIVDVTDAQQANGYAYANDSPVSNTDPSGTRAAALHNGGYCGKKCRRTEVDPDWGNTTVGNTSITVQRNGDGSSTLGGTLDVPNTVDAEWLAWGINRRMQLWLYHHPNGVMTEADLLQMAIDTCATEMASKVMTCGNGPGSFMQGMHLRLNEIEFVNKHGSYASEDDIANFKATQRAGEAGAGVDGGGASGGADEGGRGRGGKSRGGDSRGGKSSAMAPRDGRGRSGACHSHSFPTGTKVVRADGSAVAIDKIKIGDRIRNAAPGAKHSQTHRVDRVIVTHHDRRLVELTVAAPHGLQTVSATPTHLFWDAGRDQWVPASHLKPGDLLQTTGGHKLRITATHTRTNTGVTYDLTIHNLHTYYVLVGIAPVLVHNSGCDEWAAEFKKQNGGEIKTFYGPGGKELPMGPYRPKGPGTPELDEPWFHHTVVVRDGKVYDQWHPKGIGIDEYKTRFDYAEDIDFGF
ncbi:RHS repeat-associated core domain-containing protein [Actinocatenispora sera]|nr:RHS repeat-associated core domain-containing protein [Actinocatenispora sera]